MGGIAAKSAGVTSCSSPDPVWREKLLEAAAVILWDADINSEENTSDEEEAAKDSD